MKSVYEASTALDAYMILNLLEQEGISGRVDGEYLPGGVGDLQAINLVRVMVDDADYERAKGVIRAWEAIQADETTTSTHSQAGGMAGFLAGLLVGAGVLFWAYNTPVITDGIDTNGDGLPDRQWTCRDNRISRSEVDRNLDGKVDSVYSFDRRGLLKEAQHDDNFDGQFETRLNYEDGLIHSREADLNQDGETDYRARFRYGSLDEVLILGEGRDARKKRQKFRMGKLVSADYDSDGDGQFDVEYDYDYFEEVK